jgi:hypothetical protein
MRAETVAHANPESGRFPGLVAALVTLASLVVGGAYFAYLVAEPFPPDLVRIVPLLWLGGALGGLLLGVRAIQDNAGARSASPACCSLSPTARSR